MDYVYLSSLALLVGVLFTLGTLVADGQYYGTTGTDRELTALRSKLRLLLVFWTLVALTALNVGGVAIYHALKAWNSSPHLPPDVVFIVADDIRFLPISISVLYAVAVLASNLLIINAWQAWELKLRNFRGSAAEYHSELGHLGGEYAASLLSAFCCQAILVVTAMGPGMLELALATGILVSVTVSRSPVGTAIARAIEKRGRYFSFSDVRESRSIMIVSIVSDLKVTFIVGVTADARRFYCYGETSDCEAAKPGDVVLVSGRMALRRDLIVEMVEISVRTFAVTDSGAVTESGSDDGHAQAAAGGDAG